MDAQLVGTARAHNEAMAASGTLTHQCPGEPALGQRYLNAGYDWQYAGENVGWNSDTSEQGALSLETIMYGETPPNDGHRLNILSSNYRDVGIDILATNGRLWLTVDFGTQF